MKRLPTLFIDRYYKKMGVSIVKCIKLKKGSKLAAQKMQHLGGHPISGPTPRGN